MYTSIKKYMLKSKESFITNENVNDFVRGFKNGIKNSKLNNDECKDGEFLRIRGLAVIIVIELFVLYLAYRTFCRMPSYLCVVFVLSFILVKSINIYDIVEDKKLNNEKLEEKCRGLNDGSIRNNGLWLVYDIISLLVTLLILYYGFISLFVEMKPKNCVDVKSIKKSLSLMSNNSKSNSFKSFSVSKSKSNSYKSAYSTINV